MKIHFVETLLMLSLLIAAGSVTGRAQGLTDVVAIEVDVPHAFTVRDTTLPAGKYVVRRLLDNDPNVLEIRSANGHTAVIFDTEHAQANQIPGKAELVFDRVGDSYFLSEIWTTDSDIGYRLAKTKAEERLEGRGMKAEHHSITAKAPKRRRQAK